MVNRRQLLPFLRFGAIAFMAIMLTERPALAESPRVVVTSAKSVQLQPDEAVLTFSVANSVEGQDKSALEALERKIDEVKKALQAVPLDKMAVDIRVSPATLSTMQTNPANPGTPPAIHGKKAKSVFQVTVREKDAVRLRNAVGRLSEAAVENGGTSSAESQAQSPFKMPRNVAIAIGGGNAGDEPESVNGPTVQWLSSATALARRDAIRQAVKEAVADAEAACGDKKVTIVLIEVSDKEKPIETPMNLLSSMRMLGGGDAEPPASPAWVKVQVEVRVTCTY